MIGWGVGLSGGGRSRRTEEARDEEEIDSDDGGDLLRLILSSLNARTWRSNISVLIRYRFKTAFAVLLGY